jgi:hypothetical protein
MSATATQTNISAATAHAPSSCLNCSHPVPDRFCGRCGQDAHHTHRLTMAHMLHDIPHSVWHVDKGILYSIRTILTRPGTTIRAYLAGQRVDHFRPLSLLLVVTGVYAFLASVLHIDLMPPRPANMPEVMWEMQKNLMGYLAKYMSWYYVALVPIIAAFARLFLRRGGYNYAECLVIVAFVTAICNSLTLFSLPLSYIYSGTPQITQVMYAGSVLSFGYATWAYSTLLAHTKIGLFGRLVRGFFPFVLGVLVPPFVGTFIFLAVKWDTLKPAFEQAHRQQQAKMAPKPATAPAQQ